MPSLLANPLEQEIGLPVACLLVAIRSFDQLAQLASRLGPFYLLEGFPKGSSGSASKLICLAYQDFDHHL
jgi:hypothetical protein